MFEHLTSAPEYEPPVFSSPLEGACPFERISPSELVDAQVATSDWLASMGAPSDKEVVATERQRAAAAAAFASMVNDDDPEVQKQKLLKMNTPVAVRHHVAMLTEYDWAFIDQAQEIRGYVVSQLLEDTKLPDPKHRLRALEMLGKITEIGLFTERVRVEKIDMTDEALDAKIKAKLSKFRHVIDVTHSGETLEHEPTTDATDATPAEDS